MIKQEIIVALQEKHQSFFEYMKALSEDNFTFSLKDEKWTAGQEIEHIIKSTSPLVMGFKLPKMALKMQFGKANRPSRSYEELVERYHTKLAATSIIPGSRFQPDMMPFDKRTTLLETLQKNIQSLSKLVEQYKEEDLDSYILPHPLLGKLTLREMLYFTIYHVGHHQQNSVRNLSQKK